MTQRMMERTVSKISIAGEQHKFSSPSPNDSQAPFEALRKGRAREIYLFFADFWRATPHPASQMLLLLLSSALVATINDARILDAGLSLDPTDGRTLQTIIAFLIVFRTNQSYNRWWEGRILWGKMHSSCVELTQQAATWIDDARLARRIMNFSIAYAYAVKQILRQELLVAEDLEGIVSAAEVEHINGLAMPVMPYYCTDVIRQCIKKGLTESPQTFGAQSVARGMDIPVSQLSLQFADMSRVRNTPQPDCFRVMLHMFTLIYLLLLPLTSYNSLGYFVIVEVLLTSYLMLGLQIAADHLEDPFGHDQADLALDLFVANIATQCRATFFLGKKAQNDLTLDGGGTKLHPPRRPSGTPGLGSPATPVTEAIGDGSSGAAGGAGRHVGGVAGGDGSGGGGASTSTGWRMSNDSSARARAPSAAAAIPNVVSYRSGEARVASGRRNVDGGGARSPSGSPVMESPASGERQTAGRYSDPPSTTVTSGVFVGSTALHSPQVPPLRAAKQQPGCVVSEQQHKAFGGEFALNPFASLPQQQTPIAGSLPARFPADGAPIDGWAVLSPSVASAASAGGGTGGVGDLPNNNASQFAVVTQESSYLDPEEHEPVFEEQNPARTHGRLPIIAAPVGAGGDDDDDEPAQNISQNRPYLSSYPGEGAARTSADATATVAPRPSFLSTTITGALARNLAINHRRAQEDVRPQRRSKPRPGRGKAPVPDVEAGEGGARPLSWAGLGVPFAPSDAV
ncbi:unnamed protein product [Pylaiella littoralis]